MTSFRKVFRREVHQMAARPIYIFSSVIVMIIACTFFLTFMQEGLPEQLPVGIIDHDQSSISRRFAREINAGQPIHIVGEYKDFTEAREAMQRGEIYAFIEIPENMYSDMLAYQRPTVAVYANTGYLVGGMLSYRQLMTLANLASGALQREILRGRGMTEEQYMPVIQPIVIDAHMLGNPWTNYPVYLTTTILPGILGLMVLMLSVFSLTNEMKTRKSNQVMALGNNSIFRVVIAKMLPYTILFVALGWLLNIVMFKVMDFPMNGSFWFMCLSMAAYIMALQAIAVFVTTMVPVPRIAICLSVLYGVLAFSLSGFTYPVEYMKPVIQAWATCFPLRHYYVITVDQMLMGLPIAQSFNRLAVLLLTLVLPMPFARRLKNAYLYHNYPDD